MYILKLTNCPSYNKLVWETPLCFSILDFYCLEINDLNPFGAGIHEIQQSWLFEGFKYTCFMHIYLQFLKSWMATHNFDF